MVSLERGMSPGRQNTGRSALSSVAPLLTSVIVDVPLDMLYYYQRIPPRLYVVSILDHSLYILPVESDHYVMGSMGDIKN
jgi:hypothetical protein